MTKQTGKKKATRKQYTPEYRVEALALAEKVGVSNAAREVSIPRQSRRL
jgi:transposase-like protein